jgi:hypothetical protein
MNNKKIKIKKKSVCGVAVATYTSLQDINVEVQEKSQLPEMFLASILHSFCFFRVSPNRLFAG